MFMVFFAGLKATLAGRMLTVFQKVTCIHVHVRDRDWDSVSLMRQSGERKALINGLIHIYEIVTDKNSSRVRDTSPIIHLENGFSQLLFTEMSRSTVHTAQFSLTETRNCKMHPTGALTTMREIS